MPDPEPFCALFSYWYYKSDGPFGKITEALKRAAQRGQPVRVLVDSGAFSADTQGHRITVDEYAGWLRDTVVPEWGPWLVGCLNLDVLRDPVASWTNWSRLRTLGHDTIPVTHMGDGMEVLDRYVDAGVDYVALGAMVGKSKTRKLRWAAHVHKHVLTKHPDVRLHGLGLSAQEMVERLPWWSVDSSSFASSVRFARLLVFDPDKRDLFMVHLGDSSDLVTHARLLRNVYGVDPQELAWSVKGNRKLMLQVGGKAMQLWQGSMRSLRPVTPPPSRSADPTDPLVNYVKTPGSGKEATYAFDGTLVAYVSTDGAGSGVAPAIDGTLVYTVDVVDDVAVRMEATVEGL